jgi:hypothetical protein
MGRFKDYSYEQTVFLPINFLKQVSPGTFEYTLHNLIDNELDLSIFEERIHNDETGAPQDRCSWRFRTESLRLFGRI